MRDGLGLLLGRVSGGKDELPRHKSASLRTVVADGAREKIVPRDESSREDLREQHRALKRKKIDAKKRILALHRVND